MGGLEVTTNRLVIHALMHCINLSSNNFEGEIMLDFIALSLMALLLTRCKLCLLKFIQLTENKRQTEYKKSARIMMHRMSNPIEKRLNLTFVFASFISMESASKFGVVPYHLNLHIFFKS